MFVSKPGSKKQERLRALVENPRRRRFWAARSRRRQAVVALTLVTFAGAAAFAAAILAEPPASLVWLGAFLLLTAGSAVTATHINIAARHVAGYEGLDEFQRAEADHAARLGHHVTAVLLGLLIGIVCGFGGWLTSQEASTHAVLAVLAPLVILTTLCHAAFPACYLAWTRPDEVPDDEQI
ncbi:peptidoglycan/LPS O-acetylase OafA/YrhL [Nocardiopsis arvandica]|uniref:Peptidoglycan/LPS O-acetylase OafA/YrhL n=1 Tax=Nocardiopsis sinuspersici TaxID=501010 RepID=A0A7Y9XAZ6_9ACTN|nr:hypothetical protein [Nocardiopsis sinuspersici]NYH52466.1 peptidoglycan/LPS O-acetylase OafA/YrhL [Nocardiopsis sinuspersici]